jgi:hypothetical protein
VRRLRPSPGFDKECTRLFSFAAGIVRSPALEQVSNARAGTCLGKFPFYLVQDFVSLSEALAEPISPSNLSEQLEAVFALC